VKRFCALCLLLYGLAVLTGCGTATVVGGPAPDFTLRNLADEDVRLSDFAGQIIVVSFWASWCGPCRLDMPQLQALYKRRAGEIMLLAVSQGERPADVAAFMNKEGYSFPVLLDPDLSAGTAYSVKAVPTTFVIDGQGMIKYKRRGILIPGELEVVLSMLRRRPPDPPDNEQHSR
jgi:peroxiredoxin